MMSRPDDPKGGTRRGPAAPRLTPTTVDPVSPFDSTTLRHSQVPSESPARHETQLSDPPTTVLRPDGFRELPSGSAVGEHYEIDAKIGAGAMGEVYAARHVRLGKRVAIKVIGKQLSEDSAAIERFAMEARTLAKIQHPAIVAVEHVGELPDGRAFFIMEFLRGEVLFERMRRGRVPLPEALRVLDQTARGLDAAHAEGVVHRDIKPENIFLVHLPGEPPIVKIVDFGLSKLRVADQRAERTQSGVAIGTPMYMSPEQMRGPDVDHRTDVYALGCVAYELLLGVPPFAHALTVPELYAAHLHEAPPLPRSIWPEIPPQLDLCLFAMLAKDPAHRPTLAQVRSVLAAVGPDASGRRAATAFVAPSARSGRSPTIVTIALVALVGGIAIGSRLTRSSVTTTPAPTTTIAAPSPPAPLPPAPLPVAAPTAIAPVPPTAIVPAPAARTDRPASRGTAREVGSDPPHVTRTPSATTASGSAAIARPVDAGVAAPEPPIDVPPPASEHPTPRPPPSARDQTINPFKHKARP